MTVNQLADLLALQSDKTLMAIAARIVETNPRRADIFETALGAAFQEKTLKELEDVDYE
jgi:hypothetical protein